MLLLRVVKKKFAIAVPTIIVKNVNIVSNDKSL